MRKFRKGLAQDTSREGDDHDLIIDLFNGFQWPDNSFQWPNGSIHGTRDDGGDRPHIAPPAINGAGNPSLVSHINAAGTAVEPLGPAHFADGVSEPRQDSNPRTVGHHVGDRYDPFATYL